MPLASVITENTSKGSQTRNRKPHNGSKIATDGGKQHANGNVVATKKKTEGFKMEDAPLAFRVLAMLRIPVLMFIVIPLSFSLWCFRMVRHEFRRFFTTVLPFKAALGKHEERVEKVKSIIKEAAHSLSKSIRLNRSLSNSKNGMKTDARRSFAPLEPIGCPCRQGCFPISKAATLST